MVTLTPAELEEIHAHLHNYMHTEEAQSMKGFCQHGAVSTYDHVMNVVRLSYYLNKRFRLGADMRSLIVGSFLHDFYLYDWHDNDGTHRLHGSTHPQRALSNASRLFALNEKEQAIIRQHMWPLTFRAIPSCRESMIVCLSDKISSAIETLFHRK